MGPTDAFAKLGYVLRSPRQDWTATKNDAVCLTIWQSEMQIDKVRQCNFLDTRLHCGSTDLWGCKPGNKLRIVHLSQAIESYSGWVDVVVRMGRPDDNDREAYPWIAAERYGKSWRLLDLNRQSGHFSAETQRI
jgi:hypothetical protein